MNYQERLFRISKIQTFESNSQLPSMLHLLVPVVQNIKDTNFWKQFTTDFPFDAIHCMLFRISKIQTFESNSQPTPTATADRTSCSEYQRYKLLKAIHNFCDGTVVQFVVVQNIKDTNFWKQFTTRGVLLLILRLLFRISKIQTFESNSQQDGGYLQKYSCCSEYQRYKLLKAIHNCFKVSVKFFIVVQNIKDTNFWKQFTTIWKMPINGFWLFRISKIQTFESNSQPFSWTSSIRCVVQNIKDTNFWKQFTTPAFCLLCRLLLFRISKIQTFESNSQLI